MKSWTKKAGGFASLSSDVVDVPSARRTVWLVRPLTMS